MAMLQRVQAGTSGQSGPLITTAADRALYGLVTHWWSASHGNQIMGAAGTWEDRKAGNIAAPTVAGQLPTMSGTLDPVTGAYTAGTGAGQDNQPNVQGKTADPVGSLLSQAGQVVIPNGADWTVSAVLRGGTAATSTAFAAAGQNGGGVSLKARTSNIVDVTTIDAAGTGTIRASMAMTTGIWALVSLSWQQATGTFELWLNGAIGTASGQPQPVTATGLTLLAHSQRLAFMTGWDAGASVLRTGQGRGVYLGELFVARTYAPGNAAYRAALKAVVNQNYPTLVIA